MTTESQNGRRKTTGYSTQKYQDLVMANVIEIDSNMARELKDMSGSSSLP